VEDLFFLLGRRLKVQTMPSTIEDAIRQEAEKLIRRHEMYMTSLARSLKRKELRSGLSQAKTIRAPEHWSISRGFDPYYVRGHARAIARSIERKLAAKTYMPKPACQFLVPKPDGTQRIVQTVFDSLDGDARRQVSGLVYVAASADGCVAEERGSNRQRTLLGQRRAHRSRRLIVCRRMVVTR
jgi:hypothetical protein